MYTVEYYSAIRTMRNTTILNLQNILLSEKRQTQKSTYCIISFIWTSIIGKTNPWWKESNSLCFWKRWWELTGKGHEGNFSSDGNVLYLDLGEGNMSICIGPNPSNYNWRSVHFTIGTYMLIKYTSMLYYIYKITYYIGICKFFQAPCGKRLWFSI